MKPHFVSNWKTWKALGEEYGFNPYEKVNFSLSRGGGNSTDFEYVRKIPKKETK